MFVNRIEFWTAKRAWKLVRIIAFVQLAAVFLLALRDSSTQSSVRKGDFPIFYSGAVIAKEGRSECLYDFQCNTLIQNAAWPSLRGNVHPFVYPAFVAVLLAPLASLEHAPAQFVFIMAMAWAFLASLWMLRGNVPVLRGKFFDMMCLLVLFSPLTFAIFGGQNTALSLLCYSTFIVFAARRGAQNEFLAGSALGLWFFKPHYPLIALFFMLLARRWRVLAGALLPAVAYYLLGAWRFGLGWPAAWLNALRMFLPAEMAHNSYNMVSFNGAIRSVLSGAPGLTSAGYAAASVLCLALVSWFGREFWRSSKDEACGPGLSFTDLLFLLGPLIVLVSPHTHFYDTGLCVFALLRWQRLPSDLCVTLLGASLILLYAVASNRFLFSAAPFAVVPLYTLALPFIRHGDK